MTEPPSPPRPPSGPPRGLYFSRLKETLPSPPRPPRTTKRASSMNCNGARDPRYERSGRGLFKQGLLQHAHHAPATAAAEAYLAADLREEGIIRALADVRAGVHLRPPLADDDAAGTHPLAAVGLDAEPLALRVAAVARRTAALFMSHQIPPKP